MSGRRRMGRLQPVGGSPARRHKRRRHVAAELRARTYLARDLSRAELDGIFAARFLGR